MEYGAGSGQEKKSGDRSGQGGSLQQKGERQEWAGTGGDSPVAQPASQSGGGHPDREDESHQQLIAPEDGHEGAQQHDLRQHGDPPQQHGDGLDGSHYFPLEFAALFPIYEK
ncbi:MAG: hypothetical protein BWY77_01764 [bacterium ADurb.Bin431]|nr:MAG: hypothetical protein BWY77_01764 [bacterium ADurb.Bin431]